LAFSAAGAKVVVADVLDGSPVAERISETQRPAIYMRADVTSKQSVEKLVADTVREFGTVDILVNNAALFADLALKPFQQISEEEWDRVMLVNVRGTFQCAKAVAPVMIDNKKAASSTWLPAPRSRAPATCCTTSPPRAPWCR
jgi:NAD(P)-dependent dehydrogenase (short-subunit alcohol dehydrogenase family)